MREIVSVLATSIAGMTAADIDALERRLPPDERDRAGQLRIDGQRARFVVGRCLVRHLIGRVAATEPDGVRLEIDDSGRPLVVAPDGFFASIAHSGDYVVVAAGRRPVGVDVEEISGAPVHPRLAARVCSPTELHWLAHAREANPRRAFMQVWARKEAYGKALGVGLEFPLRAVTVGPRGTRVGGAAGRWRVGDLAVAPGYAAAIAAPGRSWRARLETVDRRILVH
jgi:4'-phosphopantetheinyl transferase